MTGNFYKIVGERLKEARLKRGFTLKDVSDRTGRGQSSISDNERGLNDIPFSVILEYCDIYGINVNDLVAGLKLTGNKRKRDTK